jgi:hypothetical protein
MSALKVALLIGLDSCRHHLPQILKDVRDLTGCLEQLTELLSMELLLLCWVDLIDQILQVLPLQSQTSLVRHLLALADE